MMRKIFMGIILLQILVYGSDTIVDTENQLEWENTASVSLKKKWKEADLYCKNLLLNNKDDWRLPTVKELKKTIIYSSEGFPPREKFNFKIKNEGFYWSSSKDSAGKSLVGVYGIDFDNLDSPITPKLFTISKARTRCVRGKVYKDDYLSY